MIRIESVSDVIGEELVKETADLYMTVRNSQGAKTISQFSPVENIGGHWYLQESYVIFVAGFMTARGTPVESLTFLKELDAGWDET